MPHDRATQDALIFVNNVSERNVIEIEPEPVENALSGRQVDLEIIILGPKRKKKRPVRKNKLRLLRQYSSKTKPDSNENDDDDSELSSESHAGSEQAKNGAQSQKPVEDSATVNEALLKRLETRFGRKVIKPDDDTYVDYMDYF